MAATLDRVRAGFIGAGRISDLHALEYIANPNAEIVAIADVESRPCRAAGAGLGLPRCEDLHRLSVAPRRPGGQRRRHPPPASPPLRGGARGDGRGQACLAAEGDDHHRRRRRSPGRAGEDGVGRVSGLREFHLLPAGDEGEGTDRPGRDRRPRVDPGQEQCRPEQDGLAGPGLRRHLAAGPSPERWRPAQPSTMAITSSPSPGMFMGLAEEVHAWIGETPRPEGGVVDAPAIISWKFPRNRFGHLEIAYSPDLELVTVHYAQDDRLEITGTSGVIVMARGHGRLVEGPALTLYAGGKSEGFSFPDADLGWEASFIHSTRHWIELASHRRDAASHRRGGARYPQVHPRRPAIGRTRPGGAGRRGQPARALSDDGARPTVANRPIPL